ncbi:MAG: glycosyltransferase [Planctomycetota bacterium]|nr:glycosyltransferase [Planctomycetota bacterium]
MTLPQFSILLPFFNARETLEECLDSVLNNSFESWECVLVDDGSTDSGASLVEARAKLDCRIRLISRPHEGLVAALNTGLEHCRGPWVVRLDADDKMGPERLSGLALAIDKEPSCDVWAGELRLFPAETASHGLHYYVDWLNSLKGHGDISRDIFVESPLAHPSVTYKRELVQELGAYRDGDWPEDYDLWLRLWESGARFGKTEDIAVFWRHHLDRLTFSDPRYRPEAFRELKVELLCRTRLKEEESVWMAGAGRDSKRFARSLEKKGKRIAGWFELDPRKIGQRIYGASVHSYDDLERLFSPSKTTKSPHILAAVGVKGARQIIRDLFLSRELVEGLDFTCVA